MRVLYVVQGIQHPTMRGALRHYHFLDGIAARHRVTLLAQAKEPVTAEARAWVQERVERLRTVPVRPMETDGGELRPGSLRWTVWRARKALRLRRARTRMRAIFREEARPDRHDVVLFHGTEIFAVVEGFRELPLVVDVCDATALRLRGRIPHARGLELPWSVMAWLRARRADRKLVRQTPHRTFISARDRDALLPDDAPARIVPNGIDLDYWTGNGTPRKPARIVLTGVMDYPPNEDGALWLLEEILPRVRRQVPEAEVVIAGMRPTRRIREAARRAGGAEVTGFVEDLRPWLSGSTVFAASLRFASGLQNKVLEALAMRVPVVATPVVAEGVRTAGEGPLPLRVAGDAGAFARALVELIRSPGERRVLARRGRSYVERHFEWSRAAALLDEACVQAAAGGRGEPGGPAAGAPPVEHARGEDGAGG